MFDFNSQVTAALQPDANVSRIFSLLGRGGMTGMSSQLGAMRLPAGANQAIQSAVRSLGQNAAQTGFASYQRAFMPAAAQLGMQTQAMRAGNALDAYGQASNLRQHQMNQSLQDQSAIMSLLGPALSGMYAQSLTG